MVIAVNPNEAATVSDPAAATALPAVVQAARTVADEVLFPNALDTDRSPLVPRANLDALADAGLYGLFGGVDLGGWAANLIDGGAVVEAVASGCASTALVWLQHHSLVGTLLMRSPQDQAELLADLCTGTRRAGVVFTGALPGSPLQATPHGDGGWVLDGWAPWVSGWGCVDVLQVAACGPDDHVVSVIVDDLTTDAISAQRHELTAVNASGTVVLTFDKVVVPAGRVLSVNPRGGPGSGTLALRLNGSLALGIVSRCCDLIGPSKLDAELTAARRHLDEADLAGLPAARANASLLAVRATTALTVHTGSRAIELNQHAQRLAREALFTLVFATGPDIKGALVDELM